MNTSDIVAALTRIYEEETPSQEDLISLLSVSDDAGLRLIFETADRVRRRHVGNTVPVRGIIEFSNYCRNACRYCGLNRDNRALRRYRLDRELILDAVDAVEGEGVNTIVLQSGEDGALDPSWLARLIGEIKAQADAAVTLSVGEWPGEYYRLWREAGADRFLLKHETANPSLYEELHEGAAFGERTAHLRLLKALGYQVGAGNIVGLPGQTAKDLAADILFMKELSVDMAGIGPFIPHPHTALAGVPEGSLVMTLKVVALTRIVLKDVHLPATTALGSIHPLGREMALSAGANVIMVDITPAPYAALYEIYPGRRGAGEEIFRRLAAIRQIIHSCGRTIASGRGDAIRLCKKHPED
ncbi:MAG: [FeFe] hydrogenase H-cluster radical SAM maturase HydE [Candidatus Omnitrophica bacterium]|nr:[FeFe] hydrogenase H-cluster radical SAM maturase HydE [Candidatus Omnitrophota bacterium]